jgi:EmrB/QacA subfamily drug resistance transporter
MNAPTAGKLAPANRPLALLAAGALFMELLDGVVVSTAAPSMARSLHVSSSDISVVITAYLLTVATLIPLSGWLADRFGARRIFATAIAVFTGASLLCGISTNLTELTLLRVLQGIGASMMVPVGRLVVMRSTAKSEFIAAIAYLTWPALFAPLVAPLIGGFLSTYATWRLIFFINLPLGAAAFVLALRLVPDLRAPTTPRFDWIGLVTTSVGLGALVAGFSLLARERIPALPTTACLVVATLFLVVAVRHLRRTAKPLIDLRSLAVDTFRIAQTGGTLFRLSILAVPFLLALMLQDDFGWSATKAGVGVVFVYAGNLCIKPTTTPLLRRFGFRTVMTYSIASAGVATAACGFMTESTPLAIIALVLVLGGVFRSITFTCYNTVAFADIDDADMSHANTLFAVIQQLAFGLAVAFGALSLRLGQALRQPFGQSGSGHFPYAVAFVLMAALLIPAAIESARLPRTAGRSIGGGGGRP